MSKKDHSTLCLPKLYFSMKLNSPNLSHNCMNQNIRAAWLMEYVGRMVVLQLTPKRLLLLLSNSKNVYIKKMNSKCQIYSLV